jgi:hypothetical protein
MPDNPFLIEEKSVTNNQNPFIVEPEAPPKSLGDITGSLYSGFKDITDIPHQFNKTMIQGVPILKQFMGEDERLSNFKKYHPIASEVGKVLGGTAAAIPTSNIAAAKTGLSFLPYLLGQMGSFGTVNAVDKAAEIGSDIITDPMESGKDIGKAFGIGAAEGSIGPILGKVISPSALPLRTQQTRNAKGQFGPNAHMKDYPAAAQAAQRIRPSINELLSRGVSGAVGAIGGSFIGQPIIGGILGTMRPEIVNILSNSRNVDSLAGGISRAWNNQILAHPRDKALLNSAIVSYLQNAGPVNEEDQGIQYVP